MNELAVVYQERAQRSHLAALWRVDDRTLFTAWMEMRDKWLDSPKGRNSIRSQATRAAYQQASMLWLHFLARHGVYPWEVTTEHARGWRAWLEACGYGPATVAQRLAAVSSWYSFVITEKRLTEGAERCLFEDGRGMARENPFRANQFRRPRVNPFDKAHLLAPEDLRRLMLFLDGRRGTANGSRNYALILGHVLLGVRASELVRMRWSDIRPHWEQPGSFVFEWHGKGGKSAWTQLPAALHQAMVEYAQLAGRWPPAAGAFVFCPLRLHGMANLRNAARGEYAERPLAAKSVQRVFRSSLRQAGVQGWERYRVHDLRHTLGVLLERSGLGLNYIKDLFHHEDLATTEIYIRALRSQMVEDRHSAIVLRAIGLEPQMNTDGPRGRGR